MTRITVWTKPACVQCDAVKRRLVEGITGKRGLPMVQVKTKFQALVADETVAEFDLTAPEHASDLQWFKSIGYASAPITEYGGHAVPGYVPAEIDAVIVAWRNDHLRAEAA